MSKKLLFVGLALASLLALGGCVITPPPAVTTPAAEAQAVLDNAAEKVGEKLVGTPEADKTPQVSQTPSPTQEASVASGGALNYQVWNPDSCFGVVEEKGDGWYLLRETINQTDPNKEGYFSRTPPQGEHGDWPPHGLLFRVMTNHPLQCGELVADISYRWLINADSDTFFKFEFRLNEEHLDEYQVLASGGRLGLFIGSPEGVALRDALGVQTMVKGESCWTCANHTVVVESNADNVYFPSDLSWFGDSDVTGPLDEVAIFPMDKDAAKTLQLEVRTVDGHDAVLWFGRADAQ